MKPSALRPFVNFTTLQIKFFPSTSLAIGCKWEEPANRALPFLGVLGILAFQSIAAAPTTWNSPTFNVSTEIPDNDDVGLTNTQIVSASGISQIDTFTVTINLTGTWNGDLYAYLAHDSGFAVLLNRPGRSLDNPDGSATTGMVTTFADYAVSDIHTAIPMSGGSFTGTYQPDGRITDPLDVLDTDSRTAMLSSFNGLNADGFWTLFIADQSTGETSTLQSWSMNITSVPEPSTTLLGCVVVMVLWRRKR
jgi:subtilisin-like proprotein convertase family protein